MGRHFKPRSRHGFLQGQRKLYYILLGEQPIFFLLIHESPLTDALFLPVSKSDEVTMT